MTKEEVDLEIELLQWQLREYPQVKLHDHHCTIPKLASEMMRLAYHSQDWHACYCGYEWYGVCR